MLLTFSDTPLSILYYATNQAGTWQSEVIEDNSYSSSIAIDDTDVVHIAYSKRSSPFKSDDSLIYINNSSGTWSGQTIDSGTEIGYWPSICVNDQKVSVSYFSGGLEDSLKFASKDSGSWTVETVQDGSHGGVFSFMVFDETGDFYISHRDDVDDRLKLSSKVSGAWTTETIDAGLRIADASLALNSIDVPCISFNPYFDSSSDLFYAELNQGHWGFSSADEGDDVGWENLLAVDSNDNHYILHRAVGEKGDSLTLTAGNPGDWSDEILMDESDPSPISMAIDTNNDLHILYHSDDGIFYGTNDSGQWEIELISSSSQIRWGSIATDVSNNPHACFCGDNTDSLQYSRKEDGEWSTEVVYSPETRECDLALGSDGYAHLVFFEENLEQTLYATNQSGTWEFFEFTNTGTAPRIKLDSSKNCHISDGKYYFTNQTGPWVEVTAIPGWDSKINVDAGGYAHVGFRGMDDILYGTFPLGYSDIEK